MDLSDNFNRTENPLASGWSASSGVSAMRADGSMARGSGSTDNGSYWSGATPGSDQWIQWTIPDGAIGAGASSGCGVRHDTGGTRTNYLLELYTGTARIIEVTNGSHATLASQADTLSTTAAYRLDATGQALTATKDGGDFTGGSLSAVDASITSGTWCMYAWANYDEASNNVKIDNVAGSDGVGGGGTAAGWYSDEGGWW